VPNPVRPPGYGGVTVGPVEYVIISFPGDQFSAGIAPALADLVESGTVRILDLVFIAKDANGEVSLHEFDELDASLGFAEIDGEADGVMNEEDALLAAEVLDPETSALLVLWEDLWARPLAEVVRGAGGVITGGERVPQEIVEAALVGPTGEG
jgi:hypothetical protein